ncbi:MAG TPA: carboxypeptidase-like regulatory domain-containing protein [Gemmatimonadaceae bacterium]|nr:carboxypeptidase-like regulatory domain-containing protein [Gemmatimonadaceae bacterium]
MQHLDEGTIHAWLDGALAPNEASEAETHVQSCEQCARAVAEARGLIAASTRILGALDDIPALQTAAGVPNIATRRRKGWAWRRAGVGYAAAATVLLAAGTALVLRTVSPDKALESSVVRFEDTAAQVQAPTAATSATRDMDGARGAGAAAPSAARLNAVNEGAARQNVANRSAAQPQSRKEEEQLSVDKVVQLPGKMPQPIPPAAPPPSVRQEARKAAAEAVAETEQVGGIVQGRVLDAATGAPVKGAIVSVGAQHQMTQTDSTGKFELKQVPVGQQTVSVRALGFQSAQHAVAIPRDSVQLGFALQKADVRLQDVVVSGASAARPREVVERRRTDALLSDSLRAKTASIAGCYVIQITGRSGDADSARIDAIPRRVQLGVSPVEADAGPRRALTLDGVGRAESWTLQDDVLILVWRDNTGRITARFTRSGERWNGTLIGQDLIALAMEPCTAR